MKDFSLDLGELIKASLENRKPAVRGEKPEAKELISLGRSHHLTYMFATSAMQAWQWTDAELNTFKALVMNSMMLTARQTVDQRELERIFEQNGVKFLMLKGAVMRFMFPKPEQREMGDIDLLVYPECFENAEKQLTEAGYTVIEDVKHHKVFRSPRGTVVEVHHTLCDRTTDRKMYEYFLDCSRYSLKPGCEYTYVMSDEDFYVYFMAHMARHFYVKGCGVRNLLDIYVCRKYFADRVNSAYIEAELQKLGILDFSRQMEKMADIWLGGAESSELFDNIFEYMLTGGSYGMNHNGIWNRFSRQDSSKNTNRQLRMWYYFPPLSYMSEKYPALEEHAWLLPFYWVKRAFESVFSKGSEHSSKEERKDFVKQVDEETIRKMSDIYRSMNFGFSSR